MADNIVKRSRLPQGTNRIISSADGRIYYTYLTGEVTAYCTHYNKVLPEILQDKGLSPSLSSHVPGKIQFRKHNAPEIGGFCSLAELCCACYYGKITSVENWTKELASFRRWMRNLHLEIDHADGNQLNCTIYNLSIMRRWSNQSKSNITANIKQPIILYCGHYHNEYRAAVFFPGAKCASGKHGVELFLRFDTAKDFAHCLREIYELGNGDGKPLYMDDKEANKNRPCVALGDIATTIIYQERIAKMEKSQFCRCRAGEITRLFSKYVKKN